MKKNYKGEAFYSVSHIEAKLEKIADGLKKNLDRDRSVDVALFARGTKNDKSFAELVKSIYSEQREFVTGKEKKEGDHSGLYLFATRTKTGFEYQYVGISQQVIARVSQHVRHSAKSSATWAFLMAKVSHNQKIGQPEQLATNNFKSKTELKRAIEDEQLGLIRDCVVTYFPVDDNFLMHLVEPYIACALGCFWNSFETH